VVHLENQESHHTLLFHCNRPDLVIPVVLEDPCPPKPIAGSLDLFETDFFFWLTSLPFSPGVPLKPISPLNPFSPSWPMSPKSPFSPFRPKGPSSPTSPGGPVRPLNPLTPKLEKFYIELKLKFSLKQLHLDCQSLLFLLCKGIFELGHILYIFPCKINFKLNSHYFDWNLSYYKNLQFVFVVLFKG